VPLSLSAEPARALAARCFRRVGLWRTRLTDDHVLRAVRKTMLRKSYCVMVTDGPDGATARVVQPHAPDADLTVHLGTASGSRKARHVARTGSAVLVYQDDGRAACVVLHCDAEVVDLDADGRARWFMTAWLAFWPLGPTDEDFVVIRCRPHTIEVWDAFRGVTPAPFGLESTRMVRTPNGWAAVEEPVAVEQPNTVQHAQESG
jgi:general stress protein 26